MHLSYSDIYSSLLIFRKHHYGQYIKMQTTEIIWSPQRRRTRRSLFSQK